MCPSGRASSTLDRRAATPPIRHRFGEGAHTRSNTPRDTKAPDPPRQLALGAATAPRLWAARIVRIELCTDDDKRGRERLLARARCQRPGAMFIANCTRKSQHRAELDQKVHRLRRSRRPLRIVNPNCAKVRTGAAVQSRVVFSGRHGHSAVIVVPSWVLIR